MQKMQLDRAKRFFITIPSLIVLVFEGVTNTSDIIFPFLYVTASTERSKSQPAVNASYLLIIVNGTIEDNSKYKELLLLGVALS